jgi:hypothetical protein
MNNHQPNGPYGGYPPSYNQAAYGYPPNSQHQMHPNQQQAHLGHPNYPAANQVKNFMHSFLHNEI